jgi:hypothetical protein
MDLQNRCHWSRLSSLQNQLDLLNKRFEDALAQNVKFIDAKKLFSEIRILQDRIDELHKNNSNTQQYFPTFRQ